MVGYFLQEIELPKFPEKLTEGQVIIYHAGIFTVVITLLITITFFSITWIRGGYANSGTGNKDKDKSLELHEVGVVKRDLTSFISLICLEIIAFSGPLLEKPYPLGILYIFGVGAFGGIVVKVFDKVLEFKESFKIRSKAK